MRDTMSAPQLMIGNVQMTDQSTLLCRQIARDYLWPHRRSIFLAGAMLLAQAVLLLPMPFVQGRLLDRLFADAPSSAVLDSLQLAGCALGALVLLRALFGWGAAAVMTRVSLQVVRELTAAMHRHLQALPLAYFQKRTTGESMTRLTSDVGTLMIF